MLHEGYEVNDLVIVRDWDDMYDEFKNPEIIGFAFPCDATAATR